MAFKLVQHLEINWPVSVESPVNGGKTERSEFTAKFKVLTDPEFEKLAKTAKTDVDLVNGFLLGWSGLLDESDQEILYSAANIKALLGFPFVKNAIMKSYNFARAGVGDPALKN
jgi:hypothetical protein